MDAEIAKQDQEGEMFGWLFPIGGFGMRRVVLILLLSCSALVLPGIPSVASAQVQERAYAPEDLRVLSRSDQARVIRLEYAEQSGGRSLPDDQLQFYLDQVNRSNWRFSDIKRDIATSLSGAGHPPGGPIASVVCESKDYRYRECSTGFRGPAALTQNISGTRCVEGQNWGSRRGVVWVDRGCQGRFVEAADEASTISCESKDGRYRECRTGFRERVLLTRQLSSTRCIEGQNWGQRSGSVWVDRGCRAEFTRVDDGFRPPGSGGGSGGYAITCSSEKGRPRTCAWDSRQGLPVLVQQLSGDPCERGLSWDYRRNQIWVDRGCRARFGVAGVSTPEFSIQCTSSANDTNWCAWDNRKGRPSLVDEFSSRRCHEGRTWGYSANSGVWVSNGCSARFSNR